MSRIIPVVQVAIIISILLGTIFIPVIPQSTEKKYESWVETDLDEGYYRYIELFFNPGRVSFSYMATNPLTVSVMTESQFVSYQRSHSTDSLVTKIDEKSGTLSFDLNDDQIVFFVLSNQGSKQAKVEYMIYYTGEKMSLINYFTNKFLHHSSRFHSHIVGSKRIECSHARKHSLRAREKCV